MHLRQHSKRIGFASAIAFTILAVCFIAYNAKSNCEPATGDGSIRAARVQSSDLVLCPEPTKRAKPWAKVVVMHLISIAGKLAAS